MDAEPGYPQFLDQLGEITVIPLRRALPPRVGDVAGSHCDHLLASRRYRGRVSPEKAGSRIG